MPEHIDKEARANEARTEAIRKAHGDQELQMKEIATAMQEFETEVAARRLYHEYSDIYDIVWPKLSDVDEEGLGTGGLNVLRLADKRL